eukprot:TRINITY_DN37480_c0_g1_i1.p1 TRINITY_DN37480_c0_g1~~TRINITY_DN37480_c0_g1_i1.p1  ORF type:complete len:257 (+),score=32.40 TRINITY_DN37480_c0_g1_i1:48-773(+)
MTQAEAVVTAGKLQPERHSVTCLRCVKIPVQSVSSEPGNVSEDEHSVAVYLEQGNRHSLFVSPPSGSVLSKPSPLVCSSAVGSADTMCEQWLDVNRTHKFGAGRNSMPERGLPRSNSSPGLDKSRRHVLYCGSSEESCSEKEAMDSEESWLTSDDFRFSPETISIVPLCSEDADLLSVGTKWHPEACLPCKFQKSSKGCFDGKDCRMCHSPDHDDMSYHKRNKLLKRGTLALADIKRMTSL